MGIIPLCLQRVESIQARSDRGLGLGRLCGTHAAAFYLSSKTKTPLQSGPGDDRRKALRRWGIRGIVGGSFAEIFIGNCTALGIPCLTVEAADLRWLMETVAQDPEQEVLIDVERRLVRFAERGVPAKISDVHRNQLVTGTWNATLMLLEAGEAIERVAQGLPYLTGY